MAKKSKKTNKELLQEIREEGMFKEASDFTNKKKKYVAASERDQAMMYVLLLIAALIVLGAILGSGLVGWLVGFYPIETAITAGLCMANRGGSGDLAVLGAAKRMELISFAQISSRLGGGLMLIIASVVFGIFC